MNKILSTLVIALAIMATSSAAQETGMQIVMHPGDKRQVVLKDKQSVTFEFRLPTPGSCSFSLSTESAEVVTLGMGIMNALIKKGQPMVIRITRDANNPVPKEEFVNVTGRTTDTINVELSPMTMTSGAQEAAPNIESRYIAHGFFSGPGSVLEIDAKGSEDGNITIFGLTFTENCTCTVLEDRTLAVDKEGIVTRDAKGNRWTSQKTTFNGKEIICFFPSSVVGESPSANVEKAVENNSQCSTDPPEYVVIGQPELMIQVEGKGNFEFKIVETNDKRFGLVPMFNKGTITGLKVGNQLIELIDGELKDGFIITKDYGSLRILGVHNPVDLWVTSEQKDSFMKLK